MPGTDKYGQGIPYSLLTDAPDAQVLGQGIADAVAARCVMRFESAANRGATLTGSSPAAEGMLSYLKDVNRLDYHDGTTWTPLSPGPWIPLPPAAGISYQSGSPAYRLVNGAVELRGTLRRTDGASFTANGTSLLATLPISYRPGHYRYYTVPTEWATGINARLEIDPTDGGIRALVTAGGTGPHWVALDGVTFSI